MSAPSSSTQGLADSHGPATYEGDVGSGVPAHFGDSACGGLVSGLARYGALLGPEAGAPAITSAATLEVACAIAAYLGY